ncbi:MAG: hypothetical protein B0W54_01670 [Cellvibrio sp. 79]|nr:MAG: hypothetical protein B0W54_01670 [Cellvibrio sp. 79]
MSCKHDCPAPPLFPKTIFNRPALPHIDYRIGNYADVRAFLLDQLNKQPTLSNWTHRKADDPGIALLEADAVVADILTFYQNLYANEIYLRTAQWPQSITDLIRLGGYRLAPGVAGEATFALTIKGEKPVTVPAGFGVKAQLENSDKPAEFETRTSLEAIPALSLFSLYRPRVTPPIANGTSVLCVSHLDIELKANDRLLLGEPVGGLASPSSLNNSQIVIVDKVWDSFDDRYIQLKSPIARTASVASLIAYKLGESLRHFGHGAPATVTTITNGIANSRNTAFVRKTNTLTTNDVSPDIAADEIPLDREFKNIAVGDTVLIQARAPSLFSLAPLRMTLVRRVVRVDDGTVTWGMQSGAATTLTLNNNLGGVSSSYVFLGGSIVASSVGGNTLDIRHINILQVTAKPFVVHAAPVNASASNGNVLFYFGASAHAKLLKGRRLLFVDRQGETFEALVDEIVAGATDENDFHKIFINQTVNYSGFGYDEPTIDVFGNVVDASQGKTIEQQAIGSGDARAVFQSFALPKAPLTYLFDAARTPAQTPALEIYVDGIRWSRVETLFNSGPNCQVYIVREDADGNSLVQFGDGKTGARLASGYNNVSAIYRQGIGAHGPLKAGSKPQATDKLTDLDKVYLPADVTTGADPETAANARLAAPAKLQSLGRLVSIADYEAEVRMLPNVLKASARWDAPEGIPLIALTVLTQSGSAADIAQIRDALTAYNRCRGPARHPVLAINGHRQFIHVDALVGYDPSRLVVDIERNIKLALGVVGEEANNIHAEDGLFGLNRRDFHQSVHTSEIIAAIQNVEGVAWVKLRAARNLLLGAVPQQVDPTVLELPTINLMPSSLLSCPLHFLLSLHTKHLVLGFVSALAQMECPS